MPGAFAVWSAIFAIAGLAFGLTGAWQGGRLVRFLALPRARQTDVGVTMSFTLTFAAIGVGWSFLVGLLALYSLADAGFVQWAQSNTFGGGWWFPVLLIGIQILGLAGARQYALTAVERAHSEQSISPGQLESGGDGDLDPRAIVILVAAAIALSLALIIVWMVAKVRASREGFDLRFLTAYGFGRGPVPRALMLPPEVAPHRFFVQATLIGLVIVIPLALVVGFLWLVYELLAGP